MADWESRLEAPAASPYPTDSAQAFKEWVGGTSSWEEIEPVFRSESTRLVLLTLQFAPGEVMEGLDLKVFLGGYSQEEMSPLLMALCSNSTLTKEMVREIQAWAVEEILGEGHSDSSKAHFTGREAHVQVLHALEAAGHSAPPELLEPLWKIIRSPLPGEEIFIASYAHAILECYFHIATPDLGFLYRACRENTALVGRLARHPALNLFWLRGMAHDYAESSEVLLALVEREEAREDTEVRRVFVDSALPRVYREFLPYATSAEYVEMIGRALGEAGSFRPLLETRAPDPEEVRSILESAEARRYPESMLEVLERYGSWEAVQGMDPQAMLPLLQHADSEVRLRAQNAWGRLGHGLRREVLGGR